MRPGSEANRSKDGEARPQSGADEFAIIKKYFAPLAKDQPLAFGLADDAAIVRTKAGEDLVVTTDTMVEGQHFRQGCAAGFVARKLLRVNLSDLAAKGASPCGYLLNAAFPIGTPESWFADFAAGLALDQAAFGIGLLGGDTTATTGPACFSITALGVTPKGAMLRRAGAKSGDLVFVSGSIGDGALALAIIEGRVDAGGLSAAQREYLLERLDLPAPRLGLGEGLRGLAHGAIDVSDGLVQDLGHIASVSGVAIAIDADQVPLSIPARRLIGSSAERLRLALSGGDDYELAWTAPASRLPAVKDLAKALDLGIACIGEVTPGSGVQVRGLEFSAEQQRGFRHRF